MLTIIIYYQVLNSLKDCSSNLYPNVHAILRLLLITPVTSATVERSNSSLRFVKNVYPNNVGDERLNAIATTYIVLRPKIGLIWIF